MLWLICFNNLNIEQPHLLYKSSRNKQQFVGQTVNRFCWQGRLGGSKIQKFCESHIWKSHVAQFFSQGHDEWGIFQHDVDYSLPDIIIGPPISCAIQTPQETDSLTFPGVFLSANCNSAFYVFSCSFLLMLLAIENTIATVSDLLEGGSHKCTKEVHALPFTVHQLKCHSGYSDSFLVPKRIFWD